MIKPFRAECTPVFFAHLLLFLANSASLIHLKPGTQLPDLLRKAPPRAAGELGGQHHSQGMREITFSKYFEQNPFSFHLLSLRGLTLAHIPSSPTGPYILSTRLFHSVCLVHASRKWTLNNDQHVWPRCVREQLCAHVTAVSRVKFGD